MQHILLSALRWFKMLSLKTETQSPDSYIATSLGSIDSIVLEEGIEFVIFRFQTKIHIQTMKH